MTNVFDTFWADERTRETFRREFDTDGSADEREVFELWCKLKLWGPEHPDVKPYVTAQGIEAATAAETVELGSVHESPVGSADAPK